MPDDAGELLCSTSQVAELTGNGQEIVMRLVGARGAKGESIIRLSWKPGAVYLNEKLAGRRAVWDESSRTLIVTYAHRGFGSDVRFPEMIYGHLKMARSCVAEVLAEKVQQDFLSAEEVICLARKMFRDNALQLYGIR
ncbi:MAG: hypothetical protein DRN21_05145 [Thermoplasmata archaeon]|nr:MAG: hypothetical protein DRN21_05145 [Thermoplasmata archaeon]